MRRREDVHAVQGSEAGNRGSNDAGDERVTGERAVRARLSAFGVQGNEEGAQVVDGTRSHSNSAPPASIWSKPPKPDPPIAAPMPASPSKAIARPPVRAGNAPAPATRSPTKAAPDHLPVRTRTMARLLSQQGQHELAHQIYTELCAAAPDDVELRAEAERVVQALRPG